ncbi:MAG: exodeoxyribonuclease VII small subunit [Pyrinomonadaceae bacterium]
MAKTFESSLADLEKIVEHLENGDLPLEESLKLFETGVKLSRECRERLSDAERRIEVLMKDGDGKLSLSEISPDVSTRSSESNPVKRIVFEND